ncbi:MAG: XRE family transcriptional regulator [Gaiellales bacterium]|nr:MAG: XRE family transcriptional regulator [Gaiellales bacterium]
MQKHTRVRLKPEVIIRERLKRGWTQTELALKAGVLKNLISKLEDKAKASPATIKAVAEALGLQIEDFVEITPPSE